MEKTHLQRGVQNQGNEGQGDQMPLSPSIQAYMKLHLPFQLCGPMSQLIPLSHRSKIPLFCVSFQAKSGT